jgi:CheY-like chemotaxis protein/HPt (histidine-containing phosphotransfer) domain-containing protein
LTDAIHCIFKVTDSGIGMRQEEISKVFQQFEQAEGLSSHYGGTGLGLTIVKALVEAQSGSIDVESSPGIGSTFTIMLNFKVPAEVDIPGKKQGQQKIHATCFKGKVLVVDDDQLILRLISVILGKHDIPFITFSRPEKVLEQKIEEEVSLILLDIRMPNVNGVELCKALRKKVSSGTRIVALTAHVLPEEHSVLLESGFDEILTKPFQESTLLQLVGRPANDDESINQQPLANLELLRKMTLGDDELFQSIITQFLEETQRDIENLQHHLNFMDLSAVREVVHKLTGRTAQMGAQRISDKLRAIESDLDTGRETKSLVERIISARDDVKKLLHEMQEETV